MIEQGQSDSIEYFQLNCIQFKTRSIDDYFKYCKHGILNNYHAILNVLIKQNH